MASVTAHSKKIEVRFKIKGQRFVTTIPFEPTKANLKAAARRCDDAEFRLRAGEPWESVRADLREERIAAPPQTLGYYAQHFLDHAEVERPTLMSYEVIYNRYWAFFDKRSISGLIKSELVDHLSRFDVIWKTRRNAVSVLRRIFEIAKDDKAIQDAPTDRWVIKKGQEKKPDPYTETERDALLDALSVAGQSSPDDLIAWRYFLMAFYSGMRTGELLGLEWHHLEKPIAHVCQERVRRLIEHRTKTKYDRVVSLPKIAASMLMENPTRFQGSFVFLTPEGHPFRDADWLMKRWQTAHEARNVRRRVGPYPWRHTYVSIGLKQGVPPLLMARQTGHDLVTMSKRYARYIGDEDEAKEAIERAFA